MGFKGYTVILYNLHRTGQFLLVSGGVLRGQRQREEDDECMVQAQDVFDDRFCQVLFHDCSMTLSNITFLEIERALRLESSIASNLVSNGRKGGRNIT